MCNQLAHTMHADPLKKRAFLNNRNYLNKFSYDKCFLTGRTIHKKKKSMPIKYKFSLDLRNKYTNFTQSHTLRKVCLGKWIAYWCKKLFLKNGSTNLKAGPWTSHQLRKKPKEKIIKFGHWTWKSTSAGRRIWPLEAPHAALVLSKRSSLIAMSQLQRKDCRYMLKKNMYCHESFSFFLLLF